MQQHVYIALSLPYGDTDGASSDIRPEPGLILGGLMEEGLIHNARFIRLVRV